MRRRILLSVLGLAIALTLARGGWAEDVYITKHGKKYHKAESKFLKGKEVIKISREEAENKGYKPSQEFLKDKNVPSIEKAGSSGSAVETQP